MPTRKTTTTAKTVKKATPKRSSTTATATKRPATKAKPAATKKRAASPAGEEEVTIDRRRNERRDAEVAAVEPKLERRQKVARRRQIDPTTCERDYSDQEVEFMNALDEYKRKNGRMFPTCSEVLEVIRSLGYVQLSGVELTARSAETEPAVYVDSASYEDAELEAELV
ncbi:hypothetical protein [Aeoliella sp. SH292]|uniref:hypothetical protein n=1 Tax=Aeoliella sp. SH292 TaxID=3454464 RepID=UPI003F944E45